MAKLEFGDKNIERTFCSICPGQCAARSGLLTGGKIKELTAHLQARLLML